MSLFRQLQKGINVLRNRRESDADLADELAQYERDAVAAHIARGLSPEAARRAAQLEIGSRTAIQDHVRQSAWENIVSTCAADLRFAARQLRRNPGFAFVAILTLALGIGATTAIFSAVNPILFQPLPYPHPRRIVMISELGDGAANSRRPSFGTFWNLPASRTRTLEFTAAFRPWQPTIVGATQPERFEGQRVTSDYFRALGVAPAIGHDFQPSDDAFPGPNVGPRVAILSDELWRRRFASDPGILGRTITLDGNLLTIIGVMPASFENVVAPDAVLWAPLQYDPSLPADGREWGHHLRIIGRLRSGATARDAAAELSVQIRPATQRYAQGYLNSGGPPMGIEVAGLRSVLTAAVRPALLAILGAVLVVLLIACINVANLVLARGARRRGEFAMRAALGAGRARLTRQLLAESLLLATIGGALGIFVAAAGTRAIVALSPADLPRLAAVHLDGAVLLFGLIVTTIAGVAVGLLPARDAARHDPHEAIAQSARSAIHGHHFTRRVLVVAEVSLSLVLLVAAGLLLRSLQRVFAVDAGFTADKLLTMQVVESGRRYDDPPTAARFYEQVLAAARNVPGVESAALTSQLPLSGDYDVYGVEFEARPGSSNEAGLRYAVTPGYFDVMRIPLRMGRYLDERDRLGAPGAVVLSESFARRIFAGENPLGRRVRLGPDAGNNTRPWFTIVGIVGDVKQTSLAVNEPDAYYTTTAQWSWTDRPESLVIRAHGAPSSLAASVKQAIWSVDKDQPILRVATMSSLLESSQAERRLALVLFEVFGLVALLLAASGIYGVLAGAVAERTREIGLRAALGAAPSQILSLVIRQGMTLTAVGVAIGLAAAIATSQLLATLLFGISAFDPLTYVAVTAILATVAALACWLPARTASRIDPAITLRTD